MIYDYKIYFDTNLTAVKNIHANQTQINSLL